MYIPTQRERGCLDEEESNLLETVPTLGRIRESSISQTVVRSGVQYSIEQSRVVDQIRTGAKDRSGYAPLVACTDRPSG